MTTVCVVMPAWNEAEGIGRFIAELHAALQPWPHTFVVVDDVSSDDTGHAAQSADGCGASVLVERNPTNVGHGPSTVRALRLGLDSGADIVVALDGDGEVTGTDVAGLVMRLAESDSDLVEGVRTSRNDPLYRKGVSLSTQILVWSRAHAWPQDANTPLRAYRREALERILARLPEAPMTPNLLISAMTRRGGIRYEQVQVTARARLGASTVGTTWGKGRRLPSRRFVRFCRSAAIEWVRTPIR